MFEKNYNSAEFGARIKKIRKSKSMTQEKLAELLYLSVDSISKIENGKVVCMPEHIFHICEVFQISTDYLFFGKQRNSNGKEVETICEMLEECTERQLEKVVGVVKVMVE